MTAFQQFTRRIKKIFSKERPFMAFQIEPTSRCQLRCVMCPRTVCSEAWENGDMPLSLFDKISRHFHLVDNIHLQGWGEPLLHHELNAMIQTAKAAGCKTSLTTNGVLLTESASHDFIGMELDTMVISIAGARSETHEAIRCGSHFEQVIDNIKTLSRLKANMKSNVPSIVLSFLMTKANLPELPQVVALAKDIGSAEIVAANVDYTPAKYQDDIKAFSCKEADSECKKILEEALQAAEKAKIVLRVYPLEMEELLMCEMNPLKIVFVSHDGCVSPCVYVNLPKKGLIPRLFCGMHHEIDRQCFGNIGEDDFHHIWEGKEYKKFRDSYVRRMALNKSVFDILGDVQSARNAMAELEKLEGVLREIPLPTVCRTCYKAYNI